MDLKFKQPNNVRFQKQFSVTLISCNSIYQTATYMSRKSIYLATGRYMLITELFHYTNQAYTIFQKAHTVRNCQTSNT